MLWRPTGPSGPRAWKVGLGVGTLSPPQIPGPRIRPGLFPSLTRVSCRLRSSGPTPVSLPVQPLPRATPPCVLPDTVQPSSLRRAKESSRGRASHLGWGGVLRCLRLGVFICRRPFCLSGPPCPPTLASVAAWACHNRHCDSFWSQPAGVFPKPEIRLSHPQGEAWTLPSDSSRLSRLTFHLPLSLAASVPASPASRG